MNHEEQLLQMRTNLEFLKGEITEKMLGTPLSDQISHGFYQGYLKALAYMLRWLNTNNIYLRK